MIRVGSSIFLMGLFIWNYKAIYRLHDEQVGQWSDVVSVTVGR
ncbi:MAG: hypothetical protein ACOYMG_11005 [Candidatus Methylumidiphilus sp.]